MKVQNMQSASGNKVANQFIIEDRQALHLYEYFQSYNTIIVKRAYGSKLGKFTVYLDRNAWNYSRTTAKYRNQFLGETTKETQAKIDSGEYILTDLN